jgi:hypothetical protein
MQETEWFGKMVVCGQAEAIWAAFWAARGGGDEVSAECWFLYCVAYTLRLLTQFVFYSWLH